MTKRSPSNSARIFAIGRSTFLALLVFMLPACSGKPANGGKAKGNSGKKAGAKATKGGAATAGQVVATIGDRKITMDDVTKALNQKSPYVRMRFSSLERRKEFLKNLVRLEVLAQEAARRGLDQDPEVLRRTKRVMVDRLVETLRKDLVKFADITDKDVKDFYEANKKLYVQPRRVRVSQIVLKTKADAKRVMALSLKKKGDVRHFSQLAKDESIDEASKGKRGDLGFFDETSTVIPKEILTAAFAIKAMWQLGGPVKVKNGYAILMKTGEKRALNRSVEIEKQRIKNRVFRERRVKAINDFIDGLQKKAKVEINEANLAKVKVDLKGNTPAPKGGHQGHNH